MCQKLIILSYSFVKVLKYDAMSTDSQHHQRCFKITTDMKHIPNQVDTRWVISEFGCESVKKPTQFHSFKVQLEAWMLRREQKIIREKSFEKKKKKRGIEFNHRVSANRLSNNWAQIVLRWERDREREGERSSSASDLQQNSDASSKETCFLRILTVLL